VGVDLVPDVAGGWTIIELNGAVEFTDEYNVTEDVFDVAAAGLAHAAAGVVAAEPVLTALD
jgi:hypothetical protein